MPNNITEQHRQVARRVIADMFAVKAGEVVAITADEGSDSAMTQAFLDAVTAVNGKPLGMQFRQAGNNGEAGMPDWPAPALEAALKQVDVWLETNAAFTLYSSLWEAVMRDNDKLRYNVLAGSSVDSLERVFCHYDIALMERILTTMAEIAKKAHRIRVTSASGTDVSFEMDPANTIDFDSGDFSSKKFCTAPGYLNIVPKSGTMRGKIVFDMIMHADLSSGGQVEFEMEQGSITAYRGDKAKILEHYVKGFNEDNMAKISHMMIGLCPGVRELSWEIVEDERIWGGVDFGFGHTSPMDMPPHGQPASSHFDGISTKASVWFDDTQIVKIGEFVLPEIKEEADALLASYN